MEFKEYVAVVIAKIEAARFAGNLAECVRLLRLLRDVCAEKAIELEKTLPPEDGQP